MRVFITGIAGFIGSNLAAELVEQGHHVQGIDNLTTGRARNVPVGVEWTQGDIRVRSDLASALQPGPWDVAYHCAASYRDREAWEEDASVNVLGTINVLREAAQFKSKIVYFQTSLCYGLNPASPVDITAPINPQGSYAISKTAGEQFIRSSGLHYVSLRLANIYGPANLSGPVPAFYQRMTNGETCTIVDSRRDFVYVDDLVRVAIAAATRGHGLYHVATGKDISIEDIYYAVLGAMGPDAGDLHIERRSRGADDAPTILLDPIDTYEEFGWAANTPLIHGIRQAVDWYKANGVTTTYTHLAPVAARS